MLNLKTNHESALVQSMYLVSNGRTVWPLYMTSVRSWLFWVNAEPQDQSNLKKTEMKSTTYPFPNFHTMNISHVKVSQRPSAVGRNEQGSRSGLEQSNSCNTRITQFFITSSDFNADRVRLTKWFKCTVSTNYGLNYHQYKNWYNNSKIILFNSLGNVKIWPMAIWQ